MYTRSTEHMNDDVLQSLSGPGSDYVTPAAPALAEMPRLQALLLSDERARIAALEAQVAELSAQLEQTEKLIALLSPIVGQAIAQRVHTSRDEMAEALYPIIGQAILRAVSEAMHDLARSIDGSNRQHGAPNFMRKLIMRLRGIDPNQVALRAALPFAVQEILLIHRESGLLIHHLSATGMLPNADIVSSMLAAIRAYVQDSFGTGTEGALQSISYGDLRILIEEGSAAVIAAVTVGIEPNGFQALMRQQISALHGAFGPRLHAFNGNPLDAPGIVALLQPMMENAYVTT